MHMGVCCWVSYSRIESCVATAYIILYGNANAALGPAVTDAVSEAALRLRPIGSEDGGGGGGGSITEGAGDGLESGSGSDGIGSSDDDVSIVMCLVVGGEVLRP